MPIPLLHQPSLSSSIASWPQKQDFPLDSGQEGYLKPQCFPGPANARAPGSYECHSHFPYHGPLQWEHISSAGGMLNWLLVLSKQLTHIQLASSHLD